MKRTATIILALATVWSYAFGYEAVIKGSENLPDKPQAVYQLDKKALRQITAKKVQNNHTSLLPEVNFDQIINNKIDTEWDVISAKKGQGLPPYSRFESVIAYDEGSGGMGGFIFNSGDSASVWYRPLTEAKILGLYIVFQAETELVGQDVTIAVREVNDDWNGTYDFTFYSADIATDGSDFNGFMGATLATYTFPLTSSDVGAWLEIRFPEGEEPDIGTNDFAIQVIGDFGGDGADLYYYDGVNGSGVPYNHGFKFYNGGASYCDVGCWVPRLNFAVDAIVDYYGDPPPFVFGIENHDDVYESCDAGPYEVSASFVDMGTADFVGELTDITFYYALDGGEPTSMAMLDSPTSDTVNVTGVIPSVGVGTHVSYWWSASDNGDPVHTTSTEMSPVGFMVGEHNPDANILFITDTGSDDPYLEAAGEMMEMAGFIADDWVTFTGGSPGSCELGYYGTIIVGQGLNSYGAIAPGSAFEAALMAHMDAGGNFALISDDYIYGLGLGDTGTWEDVDAGANPFLADYLHVSSYWSDCNYGEGLEPDSSYSGVAGNLVTDGIAEFEAHPQWPDEVVAASDAEALFNVYSFSEDDIVPYGGVSFDGAYKSVFVPWDMDFVVDPAVVGEFGGNLMLWFGETTGPVAMRVTGPRDGVPAGANAPTFSYVAYDFDGSIASATLNLTVGSTETTHDLTDPGGIGLYSSAVSFDLGAGDEASYYVTVVDNDGTTGMSSDDDFWGVDFTVTSADVLYMFDSPPQYAAYGGAAGDSIMQANLSAAGITLDKWDTWDNGQADFGSVLSNYNAVVYAGIADWVMWDEKSMDHTLAEYVNNGGYLLYSSEEVLGTYTGWEDLYFEAGHFVYDVLGIEWVGNDYGYGSVAAYETNLVGGFGAEDVSLDTLWLAWGIDYVDFCDPIGYGTPAQFPSPFLGNAGFYYYNSAAYETDGGGVVFLGFNMGQLPDAEQQLLYTNFAAWAAGGSFGTPGCTDPSACNYDEAANIFDWSCEYPEDLGWCDCDGTLPEPGYDCEGNQLSVDNDIIPDTYSIQNIYPNPFNPVANVRYGIPENAKVRIDVYDITGRHIKTLMDSFQVAGYHSVNWNASSHATGVYLIKIMSGTFTQTKKVVLLK